MAVTQESFLITKRLQDGWEDRQRYLLELCQAEALPHIKCTCLLQDINFLKNSAKRSIDPGTVIGYCRAMITHQEIAAGADECIHSALLMSLDHQTRGRAKKGFLMERWHHSEG